MTQARCRSGRVYYKKQSKIEQSSLRSYLDFRLLYDTASVCADFSIKLNSHTLLIKDAEKKKINRTSLNPELMKNSKAITLSGRRGSIFASKREKHR